MVYGLVDWTAWMHKDSCSIGSADIVAEAMVVVLVAIDLYVWLVYIQDLLQPATFADKVKSA